MTGRRAHPLRCFTLRTLELLQDSLARLTLHGLSRWTTASLTAVVDVRGSSSFLHTNKNLLVVEVDKGRLAIGGLELLRLQENALSPQLHQDHLFESHGRDHAMDAITFSAW